MDASSMVRMVVPQVIVPLRRLDRPAMAALTYARSISADVTASSRSLRYLDEREHADPERPVTVVMSDVVARHPWSYLLHQTALGLKLRLYRRPNTVVVDVPYHL